MLAPALSVIVEPYMPPCCTHGEEDRFIYSELIARAIDAVANQTQQGVQTVDELYAIGSRLQGLLGQFKI